MHNKRFISGAKCPSCKEQDKIFVFEKEGVKWRACVACDFCEAFSDSMAHTDSGGVTQELPTRVNQNKLGEATLAHETPIDVVKLLDPKK